MSAENTATLQPLSSVPVPPWATSPAPPIVARPSLTPTTLITILVLQIGKLSPAAPMKRVPSGMQSLVGPSATTAAGAAPAGAAPAWADDAADTGGSAEGSTAATWVGCCDGSAAIWSRAAS